MSSQSSVKETLTKFFEPYYVKFLEQIAQEVDCPLQGKERHVELARFLSNPSRVEALYRNCSEEERRELALCYLTETQRERGIYFGGYSRELKIRNEKAVQNLLRKGLLLMSCSFYRGGKVNPPTNLRRLGGTLQVHPSSKPLIQKEGFRWLPLTPAPGPERVLQVSYLLREQDLYRLVEWVQKHPLSMTAKEIPNRRELGRASKDLSLPKEVVEKLCFLGMAAKLFQSTRINLKVAPKKLCFFELTSEERLQELAHSLPAFIELLRKLDFWLDVEPITLVLRLLGLVPCEKWFDLKPLASWITKQKLLIYPFDTVERYFSRTLEKVLFFTGWVELGYQGGELVSFRVTPFGAVGLGSSDSLPLQPARIEERLVVQPNFEILVPVECLSLKDIGLLEKFAKRASADVVNIYRLTRNSLYQAAQGEISLEEILNFLETRSGTGIPANVRQSLLNWWADFQRIKFLESADILEDEGGFSFVQAGVSNLPTMDYQNLPSHIASWEGGQIRIKEKADLFALEAFKAIAKPVGKAFQLDPEHLRSLPKCSNAYFTRLHHVLHRALGTVPQELLLTLRAYHGDFDQLSLTSLPVVIFPKQGLIQSLLQVPWFYNALVAWTGDLAVLHPDQASQVKERLLTMGFTVGEGKVESIAPIQARTQAQLPRISSPIIPLMSPRQIQKKLQEWGLRVEEEIIEEPVPHQPAKVEVSDQPVSLPPKQLRQLIEEAIENDDDLFMVYYTSSRGEITHRRVTPVDLYRDSKGWVLEGYCHLRNSDRVFRVENIQAIKVVPGEEE